MLNVVMLNVSNNPCMLGVLILSAVMLNVCHYVECRGASTSDVRSFFNTAVKIIASSQILDSAKSVDCFQITLPPLVHGNNKPTSPRDHPVRTRYQRYETFFQGTIT
jgi:hypothetical protein